MEISGNGYVIGIGKKSQGLAIEFKYTKSINKENKLANGEIALDQFSVIVSLIVF